MTIEAVGSFAVSDTDSLDVDPTTAGDVLVLPICLLTPDELGKVTEVTGGGVDTWNVLASSNPSVDTGDAELWWGVIDDTGDSTIDIEISDGATVQALGAQQFTAGDGYTWTPDSNGQSNSTDEASSSTYPPVSPSFVFELFVGAGIFNGGSPGGATEGFVYNEGDPALVQFVYGLSVSWPNLIAPEWTADEGFWSACSALLLATPPPLPLTSIYHQWANADESGPQGSVTFVPMGQTNDTTSNTTTTTRPIICWLVNSTLLQQLAPNVNSALEPDGTYYWVTENIPGQTPVSYPITVPTSDTPIDLWALKAAS